MKRYLLFAGNYHSMPEFKETFDALKDAEDEAQVLFKTKDWVYIFDSERLYVVEWLLSNGSSGINS